MSYFKTTIEIDGHEIEVGVEYDATYDPGCSSGPVESCSPPDGELTLTDIYPIDDLPEGITLEMVKAHAAEANDALEQEAWDAYHNEDHSPDPDWDR